MTGTTLLNSRLRLSIRMLSRKRRRNTDETTAVRRVRSPGHSDKLCDAVADTLVQEATRREKRALCGIEVAVHRSAVIITGRIGCLGADTIDIEGIVRSVFPTRDILRSGDPFRKS